MKKEINIEYQGVPLAVIVDYTGKYFPATQTDPEEFPEIQVLKVYAGDTDIIGIFYDDQILDIGDLCLQSIEQ